MVRVVRQSAQRPDRIRSRVLIVLPARRTTEHGHDHERFRVQVAVRRSSERLVQRSHERERARRPRPLPQGRQLDRSRLRRPVPQLHVQPTQRRAQGQLRRPDQPRALLEQGTRRRRVGGARAQPAVGRRAGPQRQLQLQPAPDRSLRALARRRDVSTGDHGLDERGQHLDVRLLAEPPAPVRLWVPCLHEAVAAVDGGLQLHLARDRRGCVVRQGTRAWLPGLRQGQTHTLGRSGACLRGAQERGAAGRPAPVYRVLAGRRAQPRHRHHVRHHGAARHRARSSGERVLVRVPEPGTPQGGVLQPPGGQAQLPSVLRLLPLVRQQRGVLRRALDPAQDGVLRD